MMALEVDWSLSIGLFTNNINLSIEILQVYSPDSAFKIPKRQQKKFQNLKQIGLKVE
jgi:hypothetical protein